MKRVKLLMVLLAVMLCTGCSGGKGGSGKTMAEKLFNMPLRDAHDMSESDFKDILTDDGILFESEYSNVTTKIADEFLGQECWFNCGFSDEDEYSGLASCEFYIDLGSGDDYKKAREKLDKYFNKKHIKNISVIEGSTDGRTIFVYVTEKLNSKEIAKIFEDEIESMKESADEAKESQEAAGVTIPDDVAEQLQDYEEAMKDVEVAKTVSVMYMEGSEAGWYFDHDFDGVVCGVHIEWMAFSDTLYAQYGAKLGFDTIADEPMDFNKIDKKFRNKFSDDRDLAKYYMMHEHGFNSETLKIDDSDASIQKWCLDEYDWDDELKEFVDLHDYVNSVDVYLAVEHNLDADTGKEFKSNKEKAEYLNGKLTNGRLWIMGHAGYDVETGREVPKGIDKVLKAYADHVKEYAYAYDGEKEFGLLYIDDDDIPELVYHGGGAHGLDNLRTFHDGEVVYLATFGDIYYVPRSGVFYSGGSQSAEFYGDGVSELKDGKITSLVHGSHSYDGDKHDLNGRSVSAAEYREAFTKAFHVDGKQPTDAVSAWGTNIIDVYLESLTNINPKPAEPVTEPVTETQAESGVQVSETQASAQPSGDYILPDSSSRYLSESEVRALSKDEMRLARNEVYARHGRKFDAEDLQAYFNSKSWYSGTVDPKNFNEDVLNAFEKANLDLIRAVEGN